MSIIILVHIFVESAPFRKSTFKSGIKLGFWSLFCNKFLQDQSKLECSVFIMINSSNWYTKNQATTSSIDNNIDNISYKTSMLIICCCCHFSTICEDDKCFMHAEESMYCSIYQSKNIWVQEDTPGASNIGINKIIGMCKKRIIVTIHVFWCLYGLLHSNVS